MNTTGYTYKIDESWEKSVFALISSTGTCVWKIVHTKEAWRMGNIYKIPLLWTANGWKWLEDIWLEGIEKNQERIPWLLYIMFTLFIKYIQSIDQETFSINIEKPLLTLEVVYRKLYKQLLQWWNIESWIVNKNTSVFRCE